MYTHIHTAVELLPHSHSRPPGTCSCLTGIPPPCLVSPPHTRQRAFRHCRLARGCRVFWEWRRSWSVWCLPFCLFHTAWLVWGEITVHTAASSSLLSRVLSYHMFPCDGHLEFFWFLAILNETAVYYKVPCRNRLRFLSGKRLVWSGWRSRV